MREWLWCLITFLVFLAGVVGVIYGVVWAFLWPLTVLARIVGAA